MHKQTLVVIVAAIVLFGLGIFGAMAYTSSGDDSSPGNVHTMQDGETMTGPMTTDGNDTMEDSSMMDDGEMTTP